MSYRELRETTEILRALGFPRLVSMENFRYPNFQLMAEILEWIVRKFDPNVKFTMKIETEQGRLLFIKTAVLTLLQKSHVRLNPKNIYQSDGHAIHELFPVLKMLYDGVKERRNGQQKRADSSERDEESIAILRTQVNTKRHELRQAIQLASEIPKNGANLYELFRDEIFAKEIRSKSLGQSLSSTQIEKAIRERIDATDEQIVEYRKRLENIESDEQELAKKIERRRRELEQLQKRLAKLQSFRPPYMDEYERFERELKGQYAEYIALFRNLHYLQHQFARIEQTEREQATNAEHSMRVTVEKMRMENDQTAPAIAGVQMDIGTEIEDVDSQQTKRIRVFGNMTGADLSDDDEEDDGDGDGDEGRIIEMEDEESGQEDEHVGLIRRTTTDASMDNEKFDEHNTGESDEEQSANDF